MQKRTEVRALNVSSLSSPALYAKCKAMNASRLTKSQFGEMMSLNGLNELCVYLKTRTSYSSVFENTYSQSFNRARFEALIKKMVPIKEQSILRYGALSGSGIDFYFALRRDVRIILSGVRHIDDRLFVDPEIAYLPQSALNKVGVDANGLEKSKNLDELVSLLSGTPYRTVVENALKDGGYVALQNALHAYVFDESDKRFAKCLGTKEYAEVKELLSELSDIITLSGLYRIKKFYSDNPEMNKQVFYSHVTSIDEKTLESMRGAQNLKEYVTLLSHTKQAKLFEGMAGRDNVEKRVLYRACEKRLAMSQNPVVCAICYDELLRIECMDISTVAESISYGLAPETAQNLLIKE